MAYGRTGINLEVDLTQGKVEKKDVTPELAETYLGGKGLNAKMAWDRLAPELDPFSPDNLLIFTPGVLVGTPVPSANRTVVTTKSPQVDFLIYSVFGGYWGAELKQAGYDTLIISGKSSTPVYLWIDDGRVEIRDASHLWGKDTFETQTLIREELKGKVKRTEKREDVQIVSIGLAGENRVYAASLEHSIAASASRGVAPIMGDKNLKAIAVHGTKDINIARPSELFELSNQIVKRSEKLREFVTHYYHDTFTDFAQNELHSGDRLTGAGMGQFWPKMHVDFNKMYKTRDVGCYNCSVNCRSVISLPGQRPIFVKCASWWQYMLTSHSDWVQSLDFYRVCESYGVDTFSMAEVLAFGTILYKEGILTKKDTDGLDLDWNSESQLKLLDKIVHREGIGDVLANNVSKAASQIGKGAEEYAINLIKKVEPLSADYYFPLFAFLSGVSDKGDLTRNISFYQFMNKFYRSDERGKPVEELYPGYTKEEIGTPDGPYPRQDKEAYIKEGYFHFPEEFQEWFLDDDLWMDVAGDNREWIVKITDYTENLVTLTDITGLCFFWTSFLPYPPISAPGMTGVAVMAKLISYATGMDTDETEALKIIKRVQNLVKGYNVRAGLRRKDDTVPKKYFEEKPEEEYLLTLDRKKWDGYLDDYYKLKGWNSEGIPTKETLDKLGLDDVKKDLERRKIL